MRILLFFLAVLFVSCSKTIAPSVISQKSVYVDRFPAIKPGLTTIDFSLSFDSLFALSQLKAGSVLYSNEEASSVVDFPLDVRLIAPISMQTMNKDQINLSLPIRLQAKPAIAGISAGTITGDLAMKVQLKWNLSSLSSLQIKEVGYDYQWIQNPSVKVLGFPVNVTTVVDQLLNQKKAVILSQLQNQLNAKITATVTKPFLFQSFFTDSPDGYRIEPHAGSAIDMRDLSFDQTSIKGQLRYSGGFKVSAGKMNKVPLFIPVRDLPTVGKPSLPFQFQLTGPELMELMKASNPQLKGKGDFTFQSSGLRFQLSQFKGKSSRIEVDFDFVLYPDNSLGFQLKDTRMEGLSFPASLFKRKIQQKMQAQAAAFRFQPSQILQRLPSSISLAKNGRVHFQKIYFDTSSVLIEGAFEGNWSLAK
jgi:regulator of protease activity HflC (stomatin/prohibitin superfamily)